MSSTTSILRFTSILGSLDEGEECVGERPISYLLEVDQCKILLDCGSTSTFGGEGRIIKDFLTSKQIQLDLILCSHGEMPYIGSLPHLFSTTNTTTTSGPQQQQQSCPIISTIPVQSLGLLALYDAYQSWERTFGDVCADGSETNDNSNKNINNNNYKPPSLDAIDSCFSHVTTLRHHQTWYLPAPHQSIQVTPIPSGHSLGGSIFLIRRGGEEIVYAPSLNHRRSSLVAGASLEHLPRRPSLLIGGCRAALQPPGTSRTEREKSFIDSINMALKNAAAVSTTSTKRKSPPLILIPIDGTSMALEMGLLLEKALQGGGADSSAQPSIPTIPKALFFCNQAQRIFDLASGMLEWTHPSLSASFQASRQNPFQLEKIKTIHSIEEFHSEYVGTAPIVVMATIATLESGFSNWLLQFVLGDPASTILFTTVPPHNAISGSVEKLDLSVRLSTSKGPYQRNKSIVLSFHEQRPLEGEELMSWRARRALEDERAKADKAFLLLKKKEEARIDHLIEGDDEEDDEGEDEENGDDTKDPSAKLSKLSFDNLTDNQQQHQQQQQTTKSTKSNTATTAANSITSAAMLRHIRWSDYRTDWKVEHPCMAADAFHHQQQHYNCPSYPLLPFDLPFEDGEGRPNRHQCFPPPPEYVPLPKDGYGERWEAPAGSSGGGISSLKLEDLLQTATTATPAPTAAVVSKEEKPMKWVPISMEVVIRCSRKLVEWRAGSASLSDGRSLKSIMESMSPQSIVFVAGSPEATGYMRNYFELSSSLTATAGSGVRCHSPSLLSTITVSSAPNVMQAKLGDSLLTSMNLIRLGSYELGLVRGREKSSCCCSSASSSSSNMMVIEYNGNMHNDNDNNNFLGNEFLLVGDPRLSELKSALKDYKLGSHFNATGDLVVPLKTGTNRMRSSAAGRKKRRIIVRRGLDNSFKIEGPLCEEYYVIRDLFYGQVAFLS